MFADAGLTRCIQPGRDRVPTAGLAFQDRPDLSLHRSTVGGRRLLERGEQAVLTSVTIAELRYGVKRLPAGRRREVLDAAVTRLVADLDDLVLPFDGSAAEAYAALRAQREDAGQPISVEDGMIAGICRARELPLATGNTKDFAGLGLDLIDPWRAR